MVVHRSVNLGLLSFLLESGKLSVAVPLKKITLSDQYALITHSPSVSDGAS